MAAWLVLAGTLRDASISRVPSCPSVERIPVRSCPKCGSPRIHRSRSRNIFERLRKNFTNDRIHRCHACGWRGWGTVTASEVQAKDNPDNRRQAPPDLDAIDRAVEVSVLKADEEEADRKKPAARDGQRD